MTSSIDTQASQSDLSLLLVFALFDAGTEVFTTVSKADEMDFS
jgi:hypothetical protein